MMGILESDILHCFKVLDLDPEASLDDVKRAFRRIVKTWHPDLFADRPKTRGMAEEKLKAVNAAHNAIRSYLSSRKKTDSAQTRTAPTASATAAAFFPDPLSRLRIQNLKSLLGAYTKSMKIENQASHLVRPQTRIKPKINRSGSGSDFKQVLREVQLQASNPVAQAHGPF